MSYESYSQKSINFESNSSIELDLLYSASLFSAKRRTHPKTSKPPSPPSSQKTSPSCCICSGPNMLAKCEQKDCLNQMHLFCLAYFFPELSSPARSCPCHSFKQLDDMCKLLNLSSHLNSGNSILSFIKSRQNYKSEQELSGKLFWFCINFQYFPYIHIKDLKSFITAKTFPSSLQDNSWVSSQITSLEKSLGQAQSSITSIKQSLPLNLKTYSNSAKPAENLMNSHRLAMNQCSKLVRNYEKSMIRSFIFKAKDYHSFSSEEKMTCAVCDNGQSVDENLIVICSECSVPVHSQCYRIGTVPEDDWLCDPCSARAAGPQCFLCPVKGGALKAAKPGLWVHVTCAWFLQGSSLGQENFDLANIDQNKFRLKCFSCGLKLGACVQCAYGRCANAFHVECRKDLFEFGTNGALWFCPGHKASRLTRAVKWKFDCALEYVRNAAAFVWTQRSERNETMKRKKKKNQKKGVEGNERKKVVLNICGDYLMVKSFVGNRLVNAWKFVEEKARGACEGFGKLESCFGIDCKVEGQSKEILITSRGNDDDVKIEILKKKHRVNLKKKRKLCD